MLEFQNMEVMQHLEKKFKIFGNFIKISNLHITGIGSFLRLEEHRQIKETDIPLRSSSWTYLWFISTHTHKQQNIEDINISYAGVLRDEDPQ